MVYTLYYILHFVSENAYTRLNIRAIYEVLR